MAASAGYLALCSYRRHPRYTRWSNWYGGYPRTVSHLLRNAPCPTSASPVTPDTPLVPRAAKLARGYLVTVNVPTCVGESGIFGVTGYPLASFAARGTSGEFTFTRYPIRSFTDACRYNAGEKYRRAGYRVFSACAASGEAGNGIPRDGESSAFTKPNLPSTVTNLPQSRGEFRRWTCFSWHIPLVLGPAYCCTLASSAPLCCGQA